MMKKSELLNEQPESEAVAQGITPLHEKLIQERRTLFENANYTAWLFGSEKEGCSEVRVLRTKKRTGSGYYDDPDKLVADALATSGIGCGVYVTLNPVHLDLMARSKNKLEWYARHGTGEDHILERRWLMIDFDPRRVSGISSNNEEHQAAIALAENVANILIKRGWTKPVLVDSGNGAHLYFPIQLPNDPEATRLLKTVLETLSDRFSTEEVEIDKSTFKAAQLTKVCGTWACKGEDTEERPHRMAQVLQFPDRFRKDRKEWELVTREQLEELCVSLTVSKASPQFADVNTHSGKSKYQPFDLEAYLADNRVAVMGRKPSDSGGSIFLLETCPWNSSHTGGAAFVGQHSTGALFAGCRHDSCRNKGWDEFRKVFDPGKNAKSLEPFHVEQNGKKTWTDLGAALEYMNSMYAVVTHGSSVSILGEGVNPVSGHADITLFSERDLKLRLKNEQVSVLKV